MSAGQSDRQTGSLAAGQRHDLVGGETFAGMTVLREVTQVGVPNDNGGRIYDDFRNAWPQ